MSESQEPEAPPTPPPSPLPASTPPSRARFWFLASSILFLAWIGVLGFLAATTAQPIVLSRPQFLVSTLDVIARVEEDADGKPKATIQVEQVHWPATEAKRARTTLEVANLIEAQGWKAAGQYIIPLVESDGAFQVAPLPRSPGFAGTVRNINPPRIYPLTPDTRGQLESIRKREPNPGK